MTLMQTMPRFVFPPCSLLQGLIANTLGVSLLGLQPVFIPRMA